MDLEFEFPASMPTLYVAQSTNETHRRLRGGPAFEMMEHIGLKIKIGNSMSIEPGPARVFVPLDGSEEFEQFINQTRSLRSTIVAIDVSFPIMRPEQIFDLNGDDSYWRQPAIRERALKVLQLADVVTTPHQNWAADLLEINPNTYILPDLHLSVDEPDSLSSDGDDKRLSFFITSLFMAFHSGMESKYERLGCNQNAHATKPDDASTRTFGWRQRLDHLREAFR